MTINDHPYVLDKCDINIHSFEELLPLVMTVYYYSIYLVWIYFPVGVEQKKPLLWFTSNRSYDVKYKSVY